VTGPVFEFSEVFNEDYLYFYGPQLLEKLLNAEYDDSSTSVFAE
jgi:hypothetical protein